MKTIEVEGKVYEAKPVEDFFTQDFGADDVGKSTCIGCDLWHKQITEGCNQGYPHCENASIIWIEKK